VSAAARKTTTLKTTRKPAATKTTRKRVRPPADAATLEGKTTWRCVQCELTLTARTVDKLERHVRSEHGGGRIAVVIERKRDS
jgi:hypothetical protein